MVLVIRKLTSSLTSRLSTNVLVRNHYSLGGISCSTVSSSHRYKGTMATSPSSVPRGGNSMATTTTNTTTTTGGSSVPSVYSAMERLVGTLQSELQHEKGNYEQAENIKRFLSHSGWTLEEKDGDVNMKLHRTIPIKSGLNDSLKVTVEFQLVSPTYSSEEEEVDGASSETGPNQPEPQETTDFSVTCERSSTGTGAIFYCTTVGSDEKFRFIVGNMRYYSNSEERNSVTAYTGPEFEDLDDALQGGVDDWLASLGVNEELCDFVDAMAIDKEQREYMRWLKSVAQLIQP